MALDIVFSLDSVITAVGMVQQVAIMIAAVVAAVLVMMAFAKAIGEFVTRRPTIKMLALAFLLAIGVMLMADGFGHHVPKGYLYFAMAFSLFVEMLNLKAGHREGRPSTFAGRTCRPKNANDSRRTTDDPRRCPHEPIRSRP